jgi:hypothetical protein
MLETTQSAVDILKQMLAQVEPPESHCLRLTFGQDGASIVVDEVRAGDVTVVHDDDERPLMVAAPPVAERVDGQTLDFNQAWSRLIMT